MKAVMTRKAGKGGKEDLKNIIKSHRGEWQYGAFKD